MKIHEEVGRFENTEEEEGGATKMPEITNWDGMAQNNTLHLYLYCQGCKDRNAYNIKAGEGVKAKIRCKAVNDPSIHQGDIPIFDPYNPTYENHEDNF